MISSQYPEKVSKTLLIDQVDIIDQENFRQNYFNPRKPLYITNTATQWPALKKWSWDFFSQKKIDQTLLIEKGNVLQGKTHFSKGRFQEFLRKIAQNKTNSESTLPSQSPYLSMFRIFDYFPELEKDVDFSLITTLTVHQDTFAWFGPGGTVTGYHIDWIDNILVQIEGRKRLWLVPPERSQFMYPSNKFDFRSTLSCVEPDENTLQKFPLFKQAHPIEVTLHPGQMLFLPRGWWHRVEALDRSISINTFGHDLWGVLFYQNRARLQGLLHHWGLYRRNNCTCHQIIDGQRIAKGR
ncbi:cupin-like domain-containing protein [Magnetococcales bacterium HHB-1]